MYLFKRIQWLVYLWMHQCPRFSLFGSTKAQVLNLLLPEHLADWRRTCEPPMHRYYKGLSSLYPLRSLSDPLRSLEHWGPLRTLLGPLRTLEILSGRLQILSGHSSPNVLVDSSLRPPPLSGFCCRYLKNKKNTIHSSHSSFTMVVTSGCISISSQLKGSLDRDGAQRRWRGQRSASGRSWSTPRSLSPRARSRRRTATAGVTAGKTAMPLTGVAIIRSVPIATMSSVQPSIPSANAAQAGRLDWDFGRNIFHFSGVRCQSAPKPQLLLRSCDFPSTTASSNENSNQPKQQIVLSIHCWSLLKTSNPDGLILDWHPQVHWWYWGVWWLLGLGRNGHQLPEEGRTIRKWSLRQNIQRPRRHHKWERGQQRFGNDSTGLGACVQGLKPGRQWWEPDDRWKV